MTKATKNKLLYQAFALLAPPLLFFLWLFTGLGVRWIASRSIDFAGSLFSANTIVMTLIWLGHLMTLINLCVYITHVHKAVKKPVLDAQDRWGLWSVFYASVTLAVLIFLFLTGTFFAFIGGIPSFAFDDTVTWNHWLLLVILLVFGFLDWSAFQRLSAKNNRLTSDAAVLWLCVYLISIPSILVTVLAMTLRYFLVTNPDWMLIFDKPEILSGETYGYLHTPIVSPSETERPLFGLFASGLEVGIIMASIMVSQIAFFALQVFREQVIAERENKELNNAFATSSK